MEDAARRKAARALTVLAIAWGAQGLIELACFDADRGRDLLWILSPFYGLPMVVGAIMLFRASEPSQGRALLLIAAPLACAQSAVFFFFHDPRVLRPFAPLAGAALALALLSIYRAIRSTAPVVPLAVSTVVGGIAGLFDASLRLGGTRWTIAADLLGTAPNMMPIATLVVAAANVALLIDLRERLHRGQPSPRPRKGTVVEWRAARRPLAVFYRVLMARFVLAVAFGLLGAIGASGAVVGALATIGDLLCALVGAFALVRFGLRAPAKAVARSALLAALLHAATSMLHAAIRFGDRASRSSLGLLAVMGVLAALSLTVVFVTAARSVGDQPLERAAKQTLLLALVVGAATFVTGWLFSPEKQISFGDREAALELVPLLLALPIATTLALLLTVRRARFVFR